MGAGAALILAACSGGVGSSSIEQGSFPFTVGGTVSGLTGTGLVLQNNAGNSLSVAADGTFTFSTFLVSGNAYNVSVLTQPTNPQQTCVPKDATGTIGTSNVTTVAVVCTAKTTANDQIGGTVTGLSGSGLVLQNDGVDEISVDASGNFTFATPLAPGMAYAVSVLSPPLSPYQNCAVVNGQGTTGAADVNNVSVSCVVTSNPTYAIGGTVSGLPAGAMLVLKDNGRDDLSLSADGSFAFAMPIPSGSAYSVTISPSSAQSLSCSIANPSGQVAGAAVTNVAIACTPQTALMVNVSGLSGTGLVLQTDSGDSLSIAANGTATFATELGAGAPYTVSVLTQPSGPAQICSITNASGTIGASPTPAVVCTTPTVTIGGTVSGLLGTGLTLQDNNGDDLAVSTNGAFTFVTPLVTGATYSVTVLSSPANPRQGCTVANATGTATANVTNIIVACADRYTVGGMVTEYSSTGLVLQDNGGDNLALTTSGAFAFPTSLAGGAAYVVTILTQPTGLPAETCSVTNGAGAVSTGNITTIGIVCASKQFTIGGSIAGLQGSGLVLLDNNGDALAVNGGNSFLFPARLNSGNKYAVTIATQPTNPSQTCTLLVGTGAGTVAAGNVTSVAIQCVTNQYSVGGIVRGLIGTGLVLQDNGANGTPVSTNGNFTLSAKINSGSTYAVTVLTQPSGPAQACNISGGAGTVTTGDVTNVIVDCASQVHTVGGTIGGLRGSGLVLQDNATDNLSIGNANRFTFATLLASGTPYAVTVLTQPTNPSQTCTVAHGSGTIDTVDVTTPIVTCVTNKYSVGGKVTGLSGGGLTLTDNVGDTFVVKAIGSFTFATLFASGSNYAVTISAQPTNPAQTCKISAGSGTVTNANVTNVVVNCANNYTVGGTVTNLSGSGLVLATNGEQVSVTASGSFAFAPPLPSGSAYAVKVLTQPSNPQQICSVTSGGAGTIAGANVTNVTVDCVTPVYKVGGTVKGLTGGGLMLLDNGGDNLRIAAGSTAFSFGTPIAAGKSYSVTVGAQPTNPWESCSVSAGAGVVTTGNVTTVAVSCTVNSYTVGGTVSGLTGSGLVLQDNRGDNLPITSGGNFVFHAPVASNAGYAVSVLTQPSGQNCIVTAGSGTVTSAAIVNVQVTCTTPVYSIGGTVTGQIGAGLVLQDNGGDNLTVAASPATGSAPFTFQTKIASGGAYSVRVFTQPSNPSQTCSVTNAGGTVTNTNVTNVAISCVTNDYYLGVKVTGLPTPLSGASLLISDGYADDSLQISNNGQFQFQKKLPSGTAYSLLIDGQPGTTVYGSETDTVCTVAGAGNGVVGGADVTSLQIDCVNQPLGFAYVTSADSNTVTSYVLSSTGGITQFGQPLATGSVPSALAINSAVSQLFVADSDPNASNILGYAIDMNTGVLTASGALATDVASPSSLTLAQVGQYGVLYATNAGSNSVSGYLLTQSGTLTEVGGSPYAVGTTPSAGTFVVAPFTRADGTSGVGYYAYFANEGDNTLSGYAVDTTAGTLSPVSNGPFATGHRVFGCPVALCSALHFYIVAGTGLSPNALASSVSYGVSGTPAYVYAAGKTPDITQFSVDGPSGQLTDSAYWATEDAAGVEKYSLGIGVTANAEYLYVPETNADYAQIPGSGATTTFTALSGLGVPGPVQVLGSYLLLTTACGLYSYPVQSDGTLGAQASSVAFASCGARPPSALLVTGRRPPPIQ